MKRIHLILTIISLAFSLALVPVSTQQAVKDYDPWYDINDDGKIDMKDVAGIAIKFGSEGTAINKTELLLELLEKVDNLNVSVLELQGNVAWLLTKWETLEAQIAQMNDTIAQLETDLAILNATKLGTPDYDTFEVYGDWLSIDTGETKSLPHNLGTTDVIVYLIGNDTSLYGIHQRDYGGALSGGNYFGAYWHDLTDTWIEVTRRDQDQNWDYIRVLIWKIP